MKEFNLIRSIVGDKITGIRLNYNGIKTFSKPAYPMRFCEAVYASFTKTIVIDESYINCEGALYSLGYLAKDIYLAQKISMNNRIPLENVTEMLKTMPVYSKQIRNVLLGMETPADVYIAYTKSDQVASLIHKFALTIGEVPLISPYSILSICGNIFVRTFLTQKICISFGCPESRKFGGVGADEVIIGIPQRTVKKFMNKQPQNSYFYWMP